MDQETPISDAIATVGEAADETAGNAGTQLESGKAAAGKKLAQAKQVAGKKLGEARVAAGRGVAKAKKDWQEMDPQTKKKVVAGGIAAAAVAIALPVAIKKARAKKTPVGEPG